MARDGFDCSELFDFSEKLLAQPKELEKAQKKLLRDQGSKLRRKTAQQARASVNRTAVKREKYEREAGHYHKSIKRGRVYTKLGQMRIRVYSNDPIGHLVEKGWTPKARDGSHGKKQLGREVFDKTAQDFDEQFQQAAEDALDEVINNL